MQRVYSLIVDNNPGVLSRIAGLFSRRGYSIDSITAGVTADPRFTRITIVASGDELILSQIEKQVRKLEDIIKIKVLKPSESVYRELIMVKIRANAAQRSEIISIADIFRAKIVDVEKESLMVELTGNQSTAGCFFKSSGRLRDPGTCQDGNYRAFPGNQGCYIHRLEAHFKWEQMICPPLFNNTNSI